jgi:gliding motility-associated protein GldM
MISMMYLVLTALLALNVSKEILDSFLVVNEGLIVTNQNFEKKVQSTYTQFEKQMQINAAKVKPNYDKALQAQKLTKDLVAYIENVKLEVIAAETGETKDEVKGVDLRKVGARDKYNEGTHYFFGDSKDGTKGRAGELKRKILDYRQNLLNLLEAKYISGMNIGLECKDGEDAGGRKQTWEMHNFYHTILAANVVLLNKLIAEVKNAEFDVISTLYNAVSGDDFKFDKIGAKVVAKSNYVLTGESFEADIFVAAYDSKQTPRIEVGGHADTITGSITGPIQKVDGEKGVGKLKLPAGAPGVKQFGGVIYVTGADGVEKKYPFNSEYVVGQPTATISATKMNVFYIGVDNPVSISVPGASNEQVMATIAGCGGTMTKAAGSGNYIVRVTAKGTCKVNASAKMGTTTKSMGSMDFRVKNVPDPVAYIAGKRGGTITKQELIAAGGLTSKMENFDFELSCPITGFTLTVKKGSDLISANSSSSRYTGEMSTFLNGVSRGSKVWFEDIRARGPQGETRNLGTISLKIM